MALGGKSLGIFETIRFQDWCRHGRTEARRFAGLDAGRRASSASGGKIHVGARRV
jgi:hypothetical protein